MKPFAFLFLLLPLAGMAQTDSAVAIPATVAPIAANSVQYVYPKPKPLSFVTNIPGDLYGFTRNSLHKKNLKDLGIVAGATGALLLLDNTITHGFQHFCRRNGIKCKEEFAPLLQLNMGGKTTNIGKLPKNINTAFYNLGQGSATMLLAGGFFIAGKINKSYRALQTANQLTEAFIAMGVGTQLLKYISGRENPSEVAFENRGMWRPVPRWSHFQNRKPMYDAFPSGHLATLISTVTIISENYPEKKWIKPVGYIFSSLCGLAMINNGVHWASDFPLGIAMGYGYGKYITKKRRFKLV